jgi:hypothetical protein
MAQASAFDYHSAVRAGRAVIAWEKERRLDEWQHEPGRIIALPPEFRRFSLKDHLEPGGTADAYLLGEGSTGLTPDTSIVFEVEDSLGCFRGKPEDQPNSGDLGSIGYAWKAPDVDRWEVWKLQPHAQAIQAAINMESGLEATDDEIAIDSQALMSPAGGFAAQVYGGAWQYGTSNITSLPNSFNWRADDDAVIHAVWNESIRRYDAQQVQCPASSS